MAGYIGSKSSVTQVDGYTEAEADAEFVNDPNGAITVDGSNVGIGVGSSVGEALHVKGTGRFENSNATPVSVHVNSGNTDYGQIFASTSSAWKNLVLNQYGGNVGIGETSPNADLVVKQSGSAFTPSGQTVALFQRNSASGSGAKVCILAGNQSSSDLNFGDVDNEDQGAIKYEHNNDAMTFTTNGSERMRLDSSGRVTMPSQPAFFAYKTSTDVNLTGASFPRDNDFGSVQFNIGNHYNNNNSRFTAPVAGRYFFEAEFYMGFNSGGVRVIHGEWRKNNTATINWNAAGGISNAGGTFYHPTVKTSVIMNLSAGDYVSLAMGALSIINGSCSIYGGSGAGTHFSGYLIG